MTPPKRKKEDLATLALASQVPVAPRVTEAAKRHAQCVVTERVYGLGGLTPMETDDPAATTLDVLGALGLLPGQPPMRSTIKHGEWTKMLAERSNTTT